jgi:demethylmenaquinone methyltransferase/2-methoxy-6-polyprenyl-1,4-benzoquinol methylase
MAPGDRWFFDRVHPLYDRVMPAASSDALEAGLAVADGSTDRVLDLGGGTGRASRAIDRPDRFVVDLSPGMLARVPPEIARVLGSASDLPVADGVVDAVIVVDALHHFPEHDRVLSEAFRVLRAGGVLVIRDFDPGTVRGRLLALGEHAIRMESTFRTPAALLRKLDRSGFTADIIETGFSYTVVGRKP